ncbi:MAG: oxygen-dependent coproporphyrinogen oxidase [Trueperaceae bacterium]
MSRRDRVTSMLRTGQQRLIAAFEAIDGNGRFQEHDWERPGGGGGRARILENGEVFEKAGVNFSAVEGERVPPSLAKQHPEAEGRPFFATGVSLVLHPQNPHVPAFHANFRYFEVGGDSGESDIWWFGGGADMTPNYPFAEDPAHFHQTLKELCDRHPQADYQAMKETCDDYFFIKHRSEMRGVGGIFYDELSPVGQGSFGADLDFTEDGLKTLIPAYLPIVERRKDTPYFEREREWQLYRRGRYAEFNLVYDRGTLFGLQTQGNIAAILMSMPPYARWEFDYQPEPGSPEAKMLELLQPREWVDNRPATDGGAATDGGTATAHENCTASTTVTENQ